MKETIKKIYKDNLVENVSQFNFDEYHYFEEDDNKVFGIFKKNITTNELRLISSFYDLLSEEELYNDNHQILDFLFGKSEDKIKFTHLKYYMIKFFNLDDDEIMIELYNLLKESIDKDAYFTKKQNIYLIIVENNIDIHFKDILKSIETDFLIKLVGFESDYYEVNNLLPSYFQIDFNNFKDFNQTNNLIINKVNLLTNNLLSNIDINIKKIIKQYILKEFINDNEMLTVIKTYFETNFNSTLAAKKCYMHRNTFLNKLDKFINTTNFNLKNYDEAVIIYMALIM